MTDTVGQIRHATRRDALDRILHLLVCPACKGALQVSDERLQCAACMACYPWMEGIPMLAIIGGSTAWQEGAQGPSSLAYQQRYQDYDRAKRYNRKYDTLFLKRVTTRREYRVLHTLLQHAGPCDTLLELPCGGGRLSPCLEAFTTLLIQADIGLGQLMFLRDERPKLGTEQVMLCASAFHTPFADRSMDGIVCIRLNHHLPSPEERERLMQELFRVARRFVIMSFFDFHSMKNTLRRFSGKSPKNTMTVSEVAALAGKYGAALQAWPRLFLYGSGHRYALMVKT